MFQALKNGPYLRLTLSSFLLTFALMVQEVLLGYELYRITKDPLALGLLGLAEAIPYITLALFGGYLADRMNRRTQMVLTLLLMLATSLLLALVAPRIADPAQSRAATWIIYGSFALMGFARGLYSPAAASLRAQIVRPEDQANAAAWSSFFWQSGMLSAPVFAGYFYLFAGIEKSMQFSALLIGICVLLALTLPSLRAVGDRLQESVLQSIKAGFAFVYENKILLYSMSLDLVAVLFSGVVALLPAFAEDILLIGPDQLGWLRAAPGLGAIFAMLLAAKFSPTLRPWRNMLIAVTGFGIATLVFALSKNFWLSCIALAITGAFDGISVVVRQYLLQTVPPDVMRGRVLAVNSVFVSSSNELGAFESGLAAKYLGLQRSVLAGAGLTLLLAFYLARRKVQFAATPNPNAGS
jgi:MFS family permease